MDKKIQVSSQHILWKEESELQVVVLRLALVVVLNKDSMFIIIEKHNSIVSARLDLV